MIGALFDHNLKYVQPYWGKSFQVANTTREEILGITDLIGIEQSVRESCVWLIENGHAKDKRK